MIICDPTEAGREQTECSGMNTFLGFMYLSYVSYDSKASLKLYHLISIILDTAGPDLGQQISTMCSEKFMSFMQ